MSLLSKRLQTSQTSGRSARIIAASAATSAHLHGAQRCWNRISANLKTSTLNSLGMRLARIPAGEFWMALSRIRPPIWPALSPDYEHDRLAALLTNSRSTGCGSPNRLPGVVHAVTIGHFKQFVAESAYRPKPERDGEGGWGYNSGNRLFRGAQARILVGATRAFRRTIVHPGAHVTWTMRWRFATGSATKRDATIAFRPKPSGSMPAVPAPLTRLSLRRSAGRARPSGQLIRRRNPAAIPQLGASSQWPAMTGTRSRAPVGSYEPNAPGDFTTSQAQRCWKWVARMVRARLLPPIAARLIRRGPIGTTCAFAGAGRGTRGALHAIVLSNWNTRTPRYVLSAFASHSMPPPAINSRPGAGRQVSAAVTGDSLPVARTAKAHSPHNPRPHSPYRRWPESRMPDTE